MTHGRPAPGTAPARRILVIDDEPGIRSLTARALSPAGFTSPGVFAAGDVRYRPGPRIFTRSTCRLHRVGTYAGFSGGTAGSQGRERHGEQPGSHSAPVPVRPAIFARAAPAAAIPPWTGETSQLWGAMWASE